MKERKSVSKKEGRIEVFLGHFEIKIEREGWLYAASYHHHHLLSFVGGGKVIDR